MTDLLNALPPPPSAPSAGPRVRSSASFGPPIFSEGVRLIFTYLQDDSCESSLPPVVDRSPNLSSSSRYDSTSSRSPFSGM
jgi:hypothetical protein